MSSERGSDCPVDAQSVTALRGTMPHVVRLSRKAIAFASAIGLAMVGGALVYGLQRQPAAESEDPIDPTVVHVTDRLASAPRDYSQVPRLGPPLPGDLGKPILDARDGGAVAALPPVGAAHSQMQKGSSAQAEREQRKRERDAALGSRLFMDNRAGTTLPAQSLPQAGNAVRPTTALSVSGQAPAPGPVNDRSAGSLHRFASSPSEMLLRAGSVIPAALITGIHSDRPGLVTAQVTQNVFDSATGRHLLVPQGARLIGGYAADVGFGQRRVLLSWNRLILPDGRSYLLDSQPAAGRSGYAGLEDGVDQHWGGVLKGALVSTLLGIGSQLGSGNDSDLVRALRRGTQESVDRAGRQVVSRELDVRPTLTIRPGFPVLVMVTRDLVLRSGGQ